MRYYVYRTGWNAANQPSASCPHRMRVATVEAATAREACDLTSVRVRVTVYNNQFLDAEEADAIDTSEAEIDRRVELEG